MRIVLTGAGGGHFYPLIAVAERIQDQANIQKVNNLEIYFFSDNIYNEKIVLEKEIKFIKIPAGKLRLYFSLQNFLDPFKSMLGFFIALWKLFKIYPDLVFVKGGYSSIPVVLAAKCLFIPILVHESDSIPGKSTLFAGKLAKRVAVSYIGASKYFNSKKVAYTGQPIMKEYIPSQNDLNEKLQDFENKNKKNILIMGGSQGSQIINNMLLVSLPELLSKYNIFHQVGDKNLNKITISSEVLLKDNPNKDNYKYFSFTDLSKYYKLADVCITRAGSSLFELSAWGIPSIIIPITKSNADHQMVNALTFEKAGCSIIIEEINLEKNLFLHEIDSILEDDEKHNLMQYNNLNSFKAGAANTIAKEIIKIGLSHI